MATRSFDLPFDLVEAVRAVAGPDIDSWVADALRRKLAAGELDRQLDEITDEVARSHHR